MIKHITLQIIFLLLVSLCTAQQTVLFNLPADTSISDKNVCQSLRVIDMRKHKDSIGGLSIETMELTETTVVPEQPLDIMLAKYFDSISANKKGEYELLLVLHDFQIMKRIRNVGLGYVYFSGDFYIGKNGKYYLLDSVDIIHETGIGKKPDKLIDLAHKIVFEQLNKYAVKAVSMKWLTLTETDAQNRREKIKAQYPIYTTEFKRGIYYTVDQFLANSPLDTAMVLDVEMSADGKRQYFFHYLNARGRKDKQIRVDDFFAIYDGTSWYIGGKERIKKMFYTDGEFIATRKKWGALIKHDGDMISASVMGATAFGLVGAVIIGGIEMAAKENNDVGLVYYVCRFDPAQKKFIPFKRLE